MDKKLILDLIASSIILLFIIGPRFNSWGLDSKAMFSGKPSEYIDTYRYLYYCGIYLLTYIVLAVVVHNFPELLALLPSTGIKSELTGNLKEIFGQGSYTISFLLITMLLNNSKVSFYEERWRNILHAWARIPKSVEEIKDAIIQEDSFSPSEKYISQAINEIKREAESSAHGETLSEYWQQSIQNWSQEKENKTVNWSLIKCLFLILIVRDLRGLYGDADLQLKVERVRDLGKIIPFLSGDNSSDNTQKQELNALSSLLIECICKHIVKKYPSKQAQYTTFKNLGFNVSYHDAAETRISEAISYSILGVLLINGLTTGLLVTILDRTDDFPKWAFGGFVAICISMFVGIFAQKINASRQMEASLPVYALTLIVSTIAALIYFNWGGGVPNSLGRIMLALSFSTVSVIVFLSLEDINHDRHAVFSTSFTHAIFLAIVMAILQILISLSYTYSNCESDCGKAVLTRINDESFKLFQLGLVGLVKGFFLGGLISYLIQDSLRRQQLAALRNTPRVKFNNIITLESDGLERRVDTKNISKSGAMIKCECGLKPGDQISISAPFLGKIKSIVRWTQPLRMGKQLAGIEFIDDQLELHSFIRQQYGEFYA